jgi:nucleoside-diphosphate-sugar epimerase
MISVYGATGFIGNTFCKTFPGESIAIPRNQKIPMSKDIVYFISTTTNYNVFDDAKLDINTNLVVLMDTLEKIKESKEDHVFNFISSWFVYGECSLPAKETSCCNPRGFYSITKLCAEQLVESYCKTFSIPYRIIRLANVYGKNDTGVSKKKNALQFLIGCLKQDKEIQLYHDGSFIRDYIHVKDVCRAVRLVMNKGNTEEVYNVGSGKPYQFKDLINIAADNLKSSSVIGSMDTPKFHELVQVKDMVLDITKIKNLGYSESINIKEGIKELCQS